MTSQQSRRQLGSGMCVFIGQQHARKDSVLNDDASDMWYGAAAAFRY